MAYLLTPLWWVLTVVITVIYALLVVCIAPWLPRSLKNRWLSFLPRSWGTALVWANLGRIRVYQTAEHLPAPIIFMSNHQSLADIPVLLTLLPKGLRFFSKKEVFQVPLMGWAMQILGFISIDRQNRERAIASLDVAAEIITRKQISVWLAPEGTRSINGDLGPLKKGPFYLANQAKVPIVPVWIEGTHEILPKHSFLVKSRVIVDACIGQPIEDHLKGSLTHDELEERTRTKLLELQKFCREKRNENPPPEAPTIGMKLYPYSKTSSEN